MKYKLINRQTGQETICDKVTIDGLDYYVSDGEIKDGFYTDGEDLFEATLNNIPLQPTEDFKKVIATNNPNIDIPKVVNEVEIEGFAWEEAKRKFYADEGREPNINNEKDCLLVGVLQEGITYSYNKSQETHPFSEQDMLDFVLWKDENKFSVISTKEDWVSELLEYSGCVYTTKELLQLWQEQQPKIVYYE